MELQSGWGKNEEGQKITKTKNKLGRKGAKKVGWGTGA